MQLTDNEKKIADKIIEELSGLSIEDAKKILDSVRLSIQKSSRVTA